MDKIPLKQHIRNFDWKLDGRTLRVGMGCAGFGGRTPDYHDSLEEDLPVLMKSYEMGFRYYDTSRSYGNSEQTVGEFVKRIPRDSIFLATKSHYPFRRMERAKAMEHFKTNFYQSFERLQTDHINLFQIHDTESYSACEEEVMPFLLDRKAEGLIDYIGVGMRSQNAHATAILSGQVDSVLSYINYSLLTHCADEIIELAQKYNVSFVNASVLHFGAFKKELEPHFLRGAGGDRAKEMKALCDEIGVNVIHASLQCSLFNPGIDMLLNGAHRISNLESTVEAMRAVIRPDQWMRIAELQETFPEFHTQVNMPV